MEELFYPEHVQKVLSELPADEDLFDLADFFKMFSDSTRVRILSALSIHELCIYDIANLLGISQSAVSHQLRLLRGARLVRSRREGKVIFYELDDDHVKHIFREGLDHIKE